MRLLTALVLALAACPPAAAAILHVQPDGLGDYPTIQAAIAAAAEGDSVLLADGVFSGPGNRDLLFLGKPITVASASGDPTLCIIDCGGWAEPHRGVRFLDGEGPGSVLAGITIRDGRAYIIFEDHGGGIFIGFGASPRIVGCVIRDCWAEVGGALYADEQCSPALIDCVFEGNEAHVCSAVALNNDGSALVMGCRFLDNTCYYGGALGYQWWPVLAAAKTPTAGRLVPRSAGDRELAVLTVDDCLFAGNQSRWYAGAGIDFAGDRLILRNSVLVHSCGDGGAEGGGAINVSSNPEQLSLVENCTFAFNSGDESDPCDIEMELGFLQVVNSLFAFAADNEIGCTPTTAVELSCTDLHTNYGPWNWPSCVEDQYGMSGNFDADPLFCDAEAGDYRLAAGSPCLPAGNDCGVQIGALGLGCGTTAVGAAVPAPLALAAQPNPFNPHVTLRFALAEAAEARLEILSVAGRRLRVLTAGRLESGEQALVWDGRDEAGRALPSGVYLARLLAPGRIEQVKLVLLR